MAENITSSPKPMSSTNAIDPIGQTPMNNPTIPSPSNLSHSSPVDIPQISSPSLSQISQHQQSQQQNQLQQHQPTLQPQKSQQIGFNVNTNLQQQQQLTPQLFQHQHQNIIGMGLSGLQSQQGMHRSASLSRMNHIQQQPQQDFQQQQVLQQQVPQQQQQLGMLRQTANVYGQMNFGGPVMSQQQHGQQLQQQLLQQSQQPQSQLLQQSQQPQSQQQLQSQQQSQQQQSQQQQLQQSQQQQLQQSQQQQLQHSQQQQLQQSQQQQLQQSQQQQMQQSQHQQMQQSQHHQMQQSPQQPIQQSQQQQQQVHPQAQLQQSSQQQQPSQQQQQVQPQQMTNGNFSLSSLTGQSGHLPVLSSQAAAAQFNMLTSPRQRASIIQGSQLQPGNATGQTMQGLQALQMMGSLGFGSQIKANAPMNYGQQRINPSQLRQQLSQQNSLSSSQKLQGQTLPRASSHLAFMNPQLSARSQNGQAMMQNTLSQQQQQWLKQMPSMSSPNAPSLRQQHQRQLLQQQMTSSSPLQQNMSFNPQQLSHLVQQQSMGHPQLLPQTQSNPLVQQHQSPNTLQAHQQPNQILQQQQSLSQQQQQQPQKMHGLAKSMSLTVSQPDANLSGTTAQGGSSSQGTEATNQLLGKRKIQDLVSQVNPRVRLDDEVQDILLYSADDFIDSVVSYACKLAKHRKSSILEAKDVLLHLERNWHLTLPGYSAEDKEHQRDTAKNDVHRKRLDVIRKSMESSQREEVLKTSDSRDTMRQGMMVNVSGGNNVVRPLTPDLDQLQSISGPQSHQQVMRFDGS